VTRVVVPDLGDFKDVEVIDVLVKPGDTIQLETPLITLETEKATMDVPSSAAGVVKSVCSEEGRSRFERQRDHRSGRATAGSGGAAEAAGSR
jgi:pyruvate/2-oxoglutarate dehydrogenase complex dihydrolipoamide acyltransferase (E2) component